MIVCFVLVRGGVGGDIVCVDGDDTVSVLVLTLFVCW